MQLPLAIKRQYPLPLVMNYRNPSLKRGVYKNSHIICNEIINHYKRLCQKHLYAFIVEKVYC